MAYKFHVESGLKFGRGCIADAFITKGEIICEMQGPSINLKQMFEKYQGDSCNPLQVDVDEWLDLEEPFVMFNHSCEPNAGIRGRSELFAIKDIHPGEEIYYDYSTTVDDNIWSMVCLCEKPACRKALGHFLTISEPQRAFYAENSALPDFIVKKYCMDNK